MPALAVGVALTFTRSAWVGACAAAAVLLVAQGLPADRRPAGRRRGLRRARAGPRSRARFVSMFDLKDPTNRDRVAMLREGRADDPRPSAGRRRPEHGRRRSTPSTAMPDAVEQVNPHLHNVPMQIAAERGLPALAVWLWFVGVAAGRSVRGCSAPGAPASLAAAALAAVVVDARRRAVRVQLRRLRVPDAVPPARHAAVRGRAATAGHRPRMTLPPLAAAPRARPRRAASRPPRPRRRRRHARSLHRRPASPASRRKRRCRSCTFQSEYVRLGGAANVAHNLAALGARVSLVGVVGRDAAADRLSRPAGRVGRRRRRPRRSIRRGRRSRRSASSRTATSRSRASTTRTTATSPATVERDVAAADRRSAARRARSLLVSDYLKGTVTSGVMATLVRAEDGTARRCSSIPKIPHLDCYAGATLVTPNHHEAETATHRRIRTDDEARAAALEFRARAQCDGVLITRGEHGMWLSSGGRRRVDPGGGARGVRRHRRRRHGRRDAGAGAGRRRARSPKRPCSPTRPPASSSASSARRP